MNKLLKVISTGMMGSKEYGFYGSRSVVFFDLKTLHTVAEDDIYEDNYSSDILSISEVSSVVLLTPLKGA